MMKLVKSEGKIGSEVDWQLFGLMVKEYCYQKR